MSEGNERDYLLGQIHQLEHENKELISEKAALEKKCNVLSIADFIDTSKAGIRDLLERLEPLIKSNLQLTEQNAKYRKALEKYGDENNWKHSLTDYKVRFFCPDKHGYEIAQEALKGIVDNPPEISDND